MGTTTELGQVDHGGELARIPWAQRRFAFVHPPWMLADFVERLRGLMPRLDVLLEGVGDEAAHVQVDGKWSTNTMTTTFFASANCGHWSASSLANAVAKLQGSQASLPSRGRQLATHSAGPRQTLPHCGTSGV
jgi:hypothetical protein